MSDPENPYAAPLAPATAPEPPAPVFEATSFVTASGGQRFCNLLIDGIAKTAIVLALAFLLGLAGQAELVTDIAPGVDILVNIGLTLLYYTLLEGLTGRSLGKLVTGTKVVDANGNPPGFGRALLRSLCRFIPFEPFSFLGSDTRGWHDSMTRTWVIKSR